MQRNRYQSIHTFSLSLLFVALLWALPQQATAQESLTRAVEMGVTETLPQAVLPNTPPAPAKNSATLTFYSSRPVFEAAFPGLPLEDFEEGGVPPGGINGCNGPIDASSNEAGCFSPGDILPGVSFDSDGAAGSQPRIALVGQGAFGATSKNIVANFFIDAFVIDFTGPDPVFAAGMDLTAYLGGTSCDVDVYGPSGLLGSTTAPCTAAGSFFGVSSDADEIVQIVIFQSSGAAEGVDNVSFGGKAEADLELTKECEADEQRLTGSFHVEVFNDGSGDADSVVVHDMLPAALTILGWTTTQGTFDPFSGLWQVGALADQGSAWLWIDVQFDAAGEYTNKAEVIFSDKDDPDSVPGDGEGDDYDECSVFRPLDRPEPDFSSGQGPGRILERGGRRFAADLSVTKEVDNATPEVGDEIEYTIKLTNSGPQTTNKVQVTDHLPECLELVGWSANMGSYDGWIWDIGQVPVDSVKYLKVQARVTDACQGEVVNVAWITRSSLPDPDGIFNVFDQDPERDEHAEAVIAVQAARSRSVSLDGSETALGVNYPNPFNPSTVVPYSLVESGYVTVKVYDLLGREVSVLVDGVVSAGVHEVEFRADRLPTGVYLIRMEAAGRVQVQRVTLMK